MIRKHSTPVETDLGTFYLILTDTLDEHGPTVMVDTEDGDVTINGVTYSGSIYFRRYSSTGSYFLDARHCDRWDDKRMRSQPMSDAAQRKLDAQLRAAVENMLADTDRVNAAKVRHLRAMRGYALADANRALDQANDYAQQLRDLGEYVADLDRFHIPNREV